MNTLNNFPIELLRTTLDLLDVDSLYKCLSVCRTWHTEIQSLAYKRVIIREDDELPEAMFKYANSAKGEKVRDLILDCTKHAIFPVASQLPKIFPNLRSIALPTCSQLDAVLEEWDQLESISESGDPFCDTVQKLLLSSRVSWFADNLTSLELKFSGRSPPCREEEVVNPLANYFGLKDWLIGILDNCPNLEHLGLKDTFLRPLDLEKIHYNLPRLKTLRLKNIFLFKRHKGNKAPQHPAIDYPAFDMKQVYISTYIRSRSCPEERAHKDWLDYFAEKYPNLESLTFNARTKSANPHQRQQAHIKQLVKLVRKCRKLKELHIQFIGGFSQQLAAALDESSIQLESANVHGNAESSTEQLKRLAEHQKKLKKLHILTLHLKKSESPPPDLYALGNAVQHFESLQEVTVAQGFDLSIPNVSGSEDYCSYKLLHSLLKYCKKLTSIDICVRGVLTKAFDEEMHDLPVAENLTHLAIHEVLVGIAETSYLNDVIFPKCPNLTSLSLGLTRSVLLEHFGNEATHPNVTHIRLQNQHQLTHGAIHYYPPLQFKELSDESATATPTRWFKSYGTLKEVSWPDLSQGHLTFDDLPSELRRVILDSLGFESLQICSLVCRRWNKEIRSLPHKQLIIKSNDKLQQVNIHYASSSTNGKEVRDVILEYDCMDKEMLFALPTILPSVKSITLSTSRTIAVRRRSVDNAAMATILEKWAKLTSITETRAHCPSVLQQFLETSKASSLTSIDLNLNSVNGRWHDDLQPTYNNAKQVIRLLKNCAGLQHFALAGTYMEVDEIEVLHQIVPQLESLALKNIDLLRRRVGDNPPPKHTNIANAAYRIKEIYFSSKYDALGAPEERVHQDWLDYFAEKYPNLESLTFHAKTKMQNPHKRQTAHIKQLVKLVGNCRHLKELRIKNIGGISEQLAKALKLNGIQLESAGVHGNAESATEQLERLAEQHKDLKKLQMTTLHLKKTQVPKDFYALSNAISAFQNLRKISIRKGYDLSRRYASELEDHCSYKLLHSLLKYCKRLESITIDMGDITKEFDSDMSTLPVAENLKKLSIYSLDRGSMEIDHLNNVILPNCPHLTDFAVNYFDIQFSNRDRTRYAQPGVTHIKLDHQHQLISVSIGHLYEAIYVLVILLPDESTSITTEKRYRMYEGEIAPYYEVKGDKLSRQHDTVLHIRSKCLNAFLNAIDRHEYSYIYEFL
ncbi:hypothetical protein MBANPS3_007470 [Mucor bainieri]